MRQKDDKHIKIVLLIVITMVIIGLFLVIYVSGEKQEILNKLEILRRSNEMTSAEIQKDKEAQEMGWDKSIDGEIVSIGGSLMLLRTATEESDDAEYKITINKNTKFYREQEITIEGDEGEEIQMASGDPVPVKYSDLRAGQAVGVHFAQRVDVDSGTQLVATEIVIYPTKN